MAIQWNELEIERLVAPMLLKALPGGAYTQLLRYVQLLDHWNQRLNLTAVRDMETFIRLHLGECLRCGQRLPAGMQSVLDWGSGAGLPGIPIQIARPELSVTLAESRTKKAAFLQEAVRELGLSRAAVHVGRAEDLPASQPFDVVVLRAVDRMNRAVGAASARMAPEGQCWVLTSERELESLRAAVPSVHWRSEVLPGTRQRILLYGSVSRLT